MIVSKADSKLHNIKFEPTYNAVIYLMHYSNESNIKVSLYEHTSEIIFNTEHHKISIKYGNSKDIHFDFSILSELFDVERVEIDYDNILQLLSSEDSANVYLGLQLMQTHEINIPILNKFRKAISFIGRKIEVEAIKYAIALQYRVLKNDNDNKFAVQKDILNGVISCTDEDINLNILTMDEDLFNVDVYDQIGAQPFVKHDLFIAF